MDFWKKLKKEKLLLSVMTMAIVDLLILAIFIVFPLMDYNFKNREASESDTENLASNTEAELVKDEGSESGEEENSGFDGPISDKYNNQGIEGYNTNKGNGGESAKDTTPVSTEDEDDILIDDNLTTTKDTTTTEETDSEEENSGNSSEELSTEDSTSNTTEENLKTEEETTDENVTDVPQTSANGSEQASASEATQ